jgi:hypothetical protein
MHSEGGVPTPVITEVRDGFLLGGVSEYALLRLALEIPPPPLERG